MKAWYEAMDVSQIVSVGWLLSTPAVEHQDVFLSSVCSARHGKLTDNSLAYAKPAAIWNKQQYAVKTFYCAPYTFTYLFTHKNRQNETKVPTFTSSPDDGILPSCTQIIVNCNRIFEQMLTLEIIHSPFNYHTYQTAVRNVKSVT